MKDNYVLITPLKNEEITIKQVIDSVKRQSIRPSLWIIVNDGSTDNSQKILDIETKNEDWIYVINKEINSSYNWLAISSVLNEGMKKLETLLVSRKIGEVKYLGILDSDITVEMSYFEKLISELKKNENIGVISGDILIKKENVWISEYNSKEPRGGARLYLFDAIQDIGGIPKTPNWDRISDLKINNLGYITTALTSAKAYQHRESFGKENQLKGYFKHGRSKYILCNNPIHVLLISLKHGFKKKPYIFSGIVFFAGYITGFFSNNKKIRDKEVIKYSNDFWKRIFK